MCPGMWKTSSLYCRFEDVQLEDDLETQFVAGVSADLTNSRKSVRSYLYSCRYSRVELRNASYVSSA